MNRPSAEYTLADQERMARARRYFEWQNRLVAKELGERVVEVGCGLGNFTGLLLDRAQVIAIDAEPACIDRVLERYRFHNNLQVFVMDATEARFRELVRFAPDSCVCLNVLEHIEDDRLAIENMAAVLPPGGRIVLIVPAHQALYGPIDRNLGHFRRYDKSTVRALSNGAGLVVRKLHYMNLAGFFGWWANARLFKKNAQSGAQISLFDNWIVPLMSKAEGAVHPPVGQSLFAVLARPD